jgi:hypothetical protein
MGAPGPRPVTDEFRLLLRAWLDHLEHHDDANWPSHDGFMRAVRTCAKQLAETIDHAAELEREQAGDDSPAGEPALSLLEQVRGNFCTGPWHCMGCGADYYGDPSAHKCPLPVKPLTGGIGIYGLDWTYG